MAKKKANAGSDDWRHLGRVGAIVGGVLATLALGAMLRVDAPPAGTEDRPLATSDGFSPPPATGQALGSDDATGDRGQDPTASDPVRPSTPITEPEVVDPTPTPPARASEPPRQAPRAETGATEPLSYRVSETDEWLNQESGWTLQFMLTCDYPKAERLLSDLDGDSRLHLVPTLHDNRVCLRVCWSHYATRDAAVSDRKLPSALLALSQKPLPRPLSDLAP